MNKLIDKYLDELKKEMHGLDKAIIQDALSDAEEHLNSALIIAMDDNPEGTDENSALAKIISEYGSPAEVVAAYTEVERLTHPSLSRLDQAKSKSWLKRFFGVYGDPKAWGAMLFMLISLITGTLYFCWVVIGLSLSISLSLFIFGIPLAILFLYSIRGFVLIEGRLVEALLGIRMPQRSQFTPHKGKFFSRLKELLGDKQVWLGMLYMLGQLILGIIYFTLLVTLLAVALSGFAIPVLQLIFDFPIMHFGNIIYTLPNAFMPLSVVIGFLVLTLTFHLFKAIGKFHGKYAKFMLVAK